MNDLALRVILVSVIYGILMYINDSGTRMNVAFRKMINFLFLILAIGFGYKLGIYIP